MKSVELYFVALALSGGLLGAWLVMGPVRSFVLSCLFVLGAPFALGFGCAGLASQGLGFTRWPDSLFHALSSGALLAGLSLLIGVLRDQRRARIRTVSGATELATHADPQRREDVSDEPR